MRPSQFVLALSIPAVLSFGCAGAQPASLAAPRPSAGTAPSPRVPDSRLIPLPRLELPRRIGRDEGGVQRWIAGGLRAEQRAGSGDPVIARQNFATVIEWASPFEGRWRFLADGALYESDTFLGALRRVGERLPGRAGRGPGRRVTINDGQLTGAPFARGGYVLDAAFSDDRRGVVAIEPGRVFATEDGGEHWREIDVGLDAIDEVVATDAHRFLVGRRASRGIDGAGAVSDIARSEVPGTPAASEGWEVVDAQLRASPVGGVRGELSAVLPDGRVLLVNGTRSSLYDPATDEPVADSGRSLDCTAQSLFVLRGAPHVVCNVADEEFAVARFAGGAWTRVATMRGCAIQGDNAPSTLDRCYAASDGSELLCTAARPGEQETCDNGSNAVRVTAEGAVSVVSATPGGASNTPDAGAGAYDSEQDSWHIIGYVGTDLLRVRGSGASTVFTLGGETTPQRLVPESDARLFAGSDVISVPALEDGELSFFIDSDETPVPHGSEVYVRGAPGGPFRVVRRNRDAAHGARQDPHRGAAAHAMWTEDGALHQRAGDAATSVVSRLGTEATESFRRDLATRQFQNQGVHCGVGGCSVGAEYLRVGWGALQPSAYEVIAPGSAPSASTASANRRPPVPPGRAPLVERFECAPQAPLPGVRLLAARGDGESSWSGSFGTRVHLVPEDAAPSPSGPSGAAPRTGAQPASGAADPSTQLLRIEALRPPASPEGAPRISVLTARFPRLPRNDDPSVLNWLALPSPEGSTRLLQCRAASQVELACEYFAIARNGATAVRLGAFSDLSGAILLGVFGLDEAAPGAGFITPRRVDSPAGTLLLLHHTDSGYALPDELGHERGTLVWLPRAGAPEARDLTLRAAQSRWGAYVLGDERGIARAADATHIELVPSRGEPRVIEARRTVDACPRDARGEFAFQAWMGGVEGDGDDVGRHQARYALTRANTLCLRAIEEQHGPTTESERTYLWAAPIAQRGIVGYGFFEDQQPRRVRCQR